MDKSYPPDVEDGLNAGFVLSAALYFKLAAYDPVGQKQNLFGWHAVLHDISRELSALSDDLQTPISIESQLATGAEDLVDSLRDVADLADERGDASLLFALKSCLKRLEAQIASSSKP